MIHLVELKWSLMLGTEMWHLGLSNPLMSSLSNSTVRTVNISASARVVTGSSSATMPTVLIRPPCPMTSQSAAFISTLEITPLRYSEIYFSHLYIILFQKEDTQSDVTLLKWWNWICAFYFKFSGAHLFYVSVIFKINKTGDAVGYEMQYIIGRCLHEIYSGYEVYTDVYLPSKKPWSNLLRPGHLPQQHGQSFNIRNSAAAINRFDSYRSGFIPHCDRNRFIPLFQSILAVPQNPHGAGRRVDAGRSHSHHSYSSLILQQ